MVLNHETISLTTPLRHDKTVSQPRELPRVQKEWSPLSFRHPISIYCLNIRLCNLRAATAVAVAGYWIFSFTAYSNKQPLTLLLYIHFSHRNQKVVFASLLAFVKSTTRMASLPNANVLKTLFFLLGCLMIATLIYTVITDGLPFRKELLTPWMATTLIDFYIIVVALAAWVAYKETNLISEVVWIILLICFGSITTCVFIAVQLLKLSSQDALQDPMYYVLLRYHDKDVAERKRKFSSVVAARILFSALGCLMLGALIYTILTDGTPFRKELFTPWVNATLVDLYINIVAISVWVAYKESNWISAFIWIVLFICLGSFTICTYIVIQLFQLSSEDPLYLVLLNSRSRDGFKMLITSSSSQIST